MTITVNPYLMLLVFVVFLVSVFLLNTWLYRPLLGFMEKREASIDQDLQSVQQSDQEINKINQEIKQILEDARLQSSQIIEQATTEAKSDYEAKIAKKKLESASKIDDFFVELEKEKSSLKSSVLSHMQDFESSLKTRISQI